MMKLNLQLFASKKGVGSTKNGRDSDPNVWAQNVLTVSLYWLATSCTDREVPKFIQATM